MANFARLLCGIALVPACWGFMRSLADALVIAGGGVGMSAEVISLFAGMAAFLLSWATLARPVKVYVLGHELTHALWGLFFGAIPSNVRVSENGGSVRLTKSNVIITLAPYFFPFYTFVVIVAALITYAFLRPLPCLPLWMFLIGFTWAFHVLFTLETLTRTQPDVKLYGRIFSWTFIFLVNFAIMMLFLAVASPLTFAQLGGSIAERALSAYSETGAAIWSAAKWSYAHVRELVK